jgi:hypothetical protein
MYRDPAGGISKRTGGSELAGRNRGRALAYLATASVAVSLSLSFSAAQAQTPPYLTTLYAFQLKDGNPNTGFVGTFRALYGTTADAVFVLGPSAAGGSWEEIELQNLELPTGLALGSQGQLYGMTLEGGSGQACSFGCGTVFVLNPPPAPGGPWTRHLLYTFRGGLDGAFPTGSPAVSPNGTIFGTTQYGGGEHGCDGILPGCGAVFALTAPESPGKPWTETLVYSFRGDEDGANPGGGLIVDENGALYGTTPVGGEYFKGSVFKLSPPAVPGGDWTKTIIYSFTNHDGDGSQPSSGLEAGPGGVLYGTTAFGGIADGGTAFALYPSGPGGPWSEKVIYRFDVQDGLLPIPNGNLAIGPNGALFGTTPHAGISASSCNYGCGLVYALYPPSSGDDWTAQILHSFAGGSDGASPLGGLVVGEDGALYGTTLYGGDLTCKPPVGCGTAFRIVP